MTDETAAATATRVPRRARGRRWLGVVRRLPVTFTFLAIMLVAGIATGAIWSEFMASELSNYLAYGLPAFADGRWWTAITGTFVSSGFFAYPLMIISCWGLAYLEWRRGWRVAASYFVLGQLFAIFATALFFWLAGFTLWPWALQEGNLVDVGPSGGQFACMAAAIALFPVPWRLRAWLGLLSFVLLSVIFWGTIYSVEHLLAVLLVLVVDRSLTPQRATVREQRLTAFVIVLGMAAIELATEFFPTDGPFGFSYPNDTHSYGFVVNILVILLAADGIRRGRRWAWTVTLVVAAMNVLVGLLTILFASFIGWDAVFRLGNDIGLAIASAAIWLILMVYLVWVRGAFRARPRRPLGGHTTMSVDDVKSLIRRDGGGTLSWMATWDGNEYLRTAAGAVAYQRHAGVAIALGDALGPVDARAASLREFVDVAQRSGLTPAFFGVYAGARRALPAWRSIAIADDTIVDLPGLTFSGKRWNDVRTALNRAAREDVEFRLTTWHAESWGVRAQLRAISESWVGDKGLPEMGFTLGSLDEAADPEVRLALAVSPNGDVDGFLSWLPVYGGDGRIDGWTLDLMRRRDGGFPTVVEFLIGSSARAFAAEGARFLSLSGAPLAHEYPPDAGVVAALAKRLGDLLEPVYGFASLHRFKQKFNPRHEPLHLMYRDEADLARITAALTRAYLPDATLRQLAGAGIELVTSR